MKNHFLKHFFALALATFVVAGCNNAGKQAKGTISKVEAAPVEAYDSGKLKDQIIEIIRNSPKGFELVDLINKAGAAYMIDITVPVEKAEKMMTTTSKSLVMGFYGIDTKYASVYNRGDIEMKINKVLLGLFVDLGISGDVDVVNKLIMRIANNQSNKDSVEVLTTQAFTEFHKQMTNGNHAKIYGITVMSANVEALYLLTQTSLYAKDNTKFLELMNNQKDRVTSVFKLLETLSPDETIKPYYESIKPIMKFFEDNKVIGNEELKKIASEIEKLRNSMI
ncbi:MAG: hypothetical protein WCS03_07370 [Bacteroidota bacterium]